MTEHMEPLISIIVPVYNVEAYLERCVDSLRNQTYRNLELILVDDGSPDRCPGICDSLAEADDRIRVIHQENAGLSGARNTGINAAKGEYLAFVDSDDYVAENFIEALYTVIQESGCAVSQCRFSYVRGESLKADVCPKGGWKEYRDEELMAQLYGPEEEATYFVVAWNKLYKRELFEQIRYPQGRIHEDEATTYRLFHEGKSLAFLDSALYGYYTENTGSITAVFSRKRLQWLQAHEERIEFFQKNGYEKLLPAAYRKLCDVCITFYYRCTENVEDGKAIQMELKEQLERYQLEGCWWIADLPSRTRLGYRIFLISPWLYGLLLRRMQRSV